VHNVSEKTAKSEVHGLGWGIKEGGKLGYRKEKVLSWPQIRWVETLLRLARGRAFSMATRDVLGTAWTACHLHTWPTIASWSVMTFTDFVQLSLSRVIPQIKTQLGDRSFVAAGPRVWMELFASFMASCRQLWTFQETTQDTFFWLRLQRFVTLCFEAPCILLNVYLKIGC